MKPVPINAGSSEPTLPQHFVALLNNSGPRALWLTVIAVAGLLIARKPSLFLNPQFWAEDGTLFFLQAHRYGWYAVLAPYAGYYHLVPRLIAACAAGCDPALAPTIYLGASFGISVATAAAVFSKRLALPCPALWALTLVLVPHSGEVMLTITNLQWVLAPLMLLLLMLPDAETPGQWAFDFFALTLLAFTGPFVVLWSPFFAWRFFRRRSLASFCFAGLAALAAVVQLYAFNHAEPAAITPGPVLFEQLLRLPGLRVWGSMSVPGRLVHKLSPGAGVFLTFAGWLGVLALVLTSTVKREARLILLGAAALVVMASLFKFKTDLLALESVDLNDRYFYIPKVFILWVLVCGLVAGAAWRRGLAGTFLCIALVVSFTNYRSPPMENFDWKSHAQDIRDGRAVNVPINPPGWTVQIEAREPR